MSHGDRDDTTFTSLLEHTLLGRGDRSILARQLAGSPGSEGRLLVLQHELAQEPPGLIERASERIDALLELVASEDVETIFTEEEGQGAVEQRCQHRGWRHFVAVAATVASVLGVGLFAGGSQGQTAVPPAATQFNRSAVPAAFIGRPHVVSTPWTRSRWGPIRLDRADGALSGQGR